MVRSNPYTVQPKPYSEGLREWDPAPPTCYPKPYTIMPKPYSEGLREWDPAPPTY